MLEHIVWLPAGKPNISNECVTLAPADNDSIGREYVVIPTTTLGVNVPLIP